MTAGKRHNVMPARLSSCAEALEYNASISRAVGRRAIFWPESGVKGLPKADAIVYI
jgi:hypothetical protein